jgi:hypothetical protein
MQDSLDRMAHLYRRPLPPGRVRRLMARFLSRQVERLLGPPQPEDPDQARLLALVEAAQNRLGLPMRSWWLKSEAALADPRNVLELYEGYQGMMRSAAWRHYSGMLLGIEQDLREKVLAGMLHPQTGADLTPTLRFGQHLLTQVIGLPEKIAQMKAEDERDFLGIQTPSAMADLSRNEMDELQRELVGP